ncbi:CGNR zinc finger domain-containing protein [Streptomyces asiaticus]
MRQPCPHSPVRGLLPSGARRWCGMAGCGNRQKAGRQRHRKKNTQPSSA